MRLLLLLLLLAVDAILGRMWLQGMMCLCVLQGHMSCAVHSVGVINA